jgi:flavorubredoxin
MNEAVEIKNNIYWVGVNDFDTNLFESIWPLPNGISYNSYLIVDEKVVLIDAVKNATESSFLDRVKKIINGRKIDYLIVNHMEPDHSGAVKMLVNIYPDIKLVGNEKTIGFIKLFYGIDKNCIVVKNEESLKIGDNEYQFFFTPMVHWPESMVTYDKKNRILFSSDIFGGFGTLNGGVFDDEVNLNFFENEIRRYFSNVIGKYSQIGKKAIEKIKAIDVEIIAPAHGPIFRKNPASIIDKYYKWCSHETECGAVIVYASMYGNTQLMAESVARGLTEKGIASIKMYNVSKTHSSYIINDIWQYRGIILGSCTYNSEIFPYMNDLLCLLKNKNLINRYIGIFGSYSWSGGALNGLKEFVEKSKLVKVEPDVESKCHPTEDDLARCRLLGNNMACALLKNENFK